MIYTIYSNNKPLYLTDSLPPAYGDNHFTADFSGRVLSQDDVSGLVFSLEHGPHSTVTVYSSDVEALLLLVKGHVKVIVAAGGLVQNQKGQTLLIFRRGKWDLPKGKLDDGETLEECAKREVEEETGVGQLAILRPITVTYHLYREVDELILKESHWYLMKSAATADPKPQAEEDIAEALWADAQTVEEHLSQMHRSVQDVFMVMGG